MLIRSSWSRFSIQIVFSLIVSFIVSCVPVHAQTMEWVRQFGTNRKDEALAVAKAPSGVYVTGDTIGVLPGESAAGLNDTDAYLTRYDEQGNALWVRQFGSTTVATDYGTGVVADQTGIYVVGWTLGALQGQSNAGESDAFIRKVDSNGSVLWTRQFGTSSQDEALGVASDGTGVYVVGRTQGNIVPATQAGISDDAFIRRFDANGTLVWTRQFGTADGETAVGVATDATGIYVAGNTGGSLATPVGGRDGFLRKFDSGGNVL
jgi:hypothetical protein